MFKFCVIVYTGANIGPLRGPPLAGPGMRPVAPLAASRMRPSNTLFTKRMFLFKFMFLQFWVIVYTEATIGGLRDPPWGARSMRPVYT